MHVWHFSTQAEMHSFYESPICSYPERLKSPFHPTQKPIQLLEHFIKIASNPGAIILDPLMGVGSTGVAAIKIDRRFIGCDLNKDYVICARARGIKERTIVVAHVLKSSMLTIVTLLGLSLGSLLGGTAIVESIFMWPGVGKLAVDAISSRDYQVIQVYVIWMAIIYVAINLITDIVYHYLDPRIRIQGEEG